MKNTDSRIVPFEAELEPYKKAIGWAWIAGSAILVLMCIHDDIRVMLQGEWDFLRFLYILLFLFILVEGAAWAQSGYHELDMTAYWLSGARHKPPTDITIIGSIVGIGCLIGIMAATAKWVSVFAVVYLVYLSVDFVWWYVRRVNYRKAIFKAKSYVNSTGGKFPERKEVELQGIREVEYFYLGRPHYTKCTIALVVTGFTLLISLSGSTLGRSIAHATAYMLFLVQIIISEFFIQRWRVLRDRKLLVLRTHLEYGTSEEEDKGEVGE